MFIDEILNKVLSPFRQVFGQWMGIKAKKDGALADVRRV